MRTRAPILLPTLFVFCSVVIMTEGGTAQVTQRPPYKDPQQPVEVRVRDLMERMTLEEKVAQMLSLWGEKNRLYDDAGRFDPARAPEVIPHGIGHIARPSDNFGRGEPGVTPTRGPRETVELTNAIQRYMVEETRLGIPVMFHEEGLHGYAARDATHFPQAVALAGTWDTDLVERVYTIVAREIRARGVHQALTPVVDVARDPRWGRIEETFGEDPHLVARMGVAAVRGFQGESLPLADGRIFATLKHMTGHGQPESGTNVGPASISERVLREVFFPPFEQAVKQTQVMSVMASYNEIDGIPSHANRWLLTDVLRDEWGFEGYVVADYFAIDQLMARHHLVASREEAAAEALAAGVDVELPNRGAFPHLVDLVRNGQVEEAAIDRAVYRVLRAKFLAGLFEQPYADADVTVAITNNAEAQALALETARKAIALLKNEGNLLPLEATALHRVAVIGPNAAETILGGYSDVPTHTVSILDGIRARVGDGVTVDYAEGARITEGRNWWADEVVLADPEQNRRRIEAAVAVARGADVAVVVVGDNEQTSREGWAENHLGDRTSLDLVGEQDALVRAVVETGVPTVVVLINGRPLSVNYIATHVPAVLEGWYLGQETGTAVANVLFGDVNPGGKLPVTIPRSVGQLPAFYNHKPSARRGYLFDTTEPLYPFGYGLSYTTFTFENLRLSNPRIAVGESVQVMVDVVNTGSRAGDEVVQLYIRDVVSSVTRPVKELKGFERITLAPGERRTVTLTVTPEDLAFYDRAMERVIEPGRFEIMVGPSSAMLETISLEVVAR